MARYFSPQNKMSRYVVFSAAFLLGASFISEIMGTNGERKSTGQNLYGSYLAGRYANSQRDNHIALDFYKEALAQDPGNEMILGQALVLKITVGDWEKSNEIAQQIIKKAPDHALANLFVGIYEFKKTNYKEATKNFEKAKKGPFQEFGSEIALAWIALAEKDADKASDLLKEKGRVELVNFYRNYHRALMADIAGKTETATKEYNELSKKYTQFFRFIQAHALHLMKKGDYKRAEEIITSQLSKNYPKHPVFEDLLESIKKKEKIEFLVKSPDEGLSEVFFQLGDALRGENGSVDYAALYLQLAIFLNPQHDLAHSAIANVHEKTKKYELAIKAYNKIPETSSLYKHAKINEALNYSYLDKIDEAKDLLEKYIAKHPDDTVPLQTLGDILRLKKRYNEAIAYLDKAVALVKAPEKEHWSLFYSRGICYERTKQWDKAEPDFKKALNLDPNRAHVLNYLGYSWVDQNKNLKEAMSLIRKAVKLLPNDGYLIDSLGWAHYRLGNYEEAVERLEEAVALKAEDPVINDHLGDAYWKVGRKVEAKYQWAQALTLKPEEEEIPKIKAKIEKGLPEEEPTKSAATVDQKPEEGVKK